jgi:hypothetical protein
MRFRFGEASVPFIGCGSEASGREAVGSGGAFKVIGANKTPISCANISSKYMK